MIRIQVTAKTLAILLLSGFGAQAQESFLRDFTRQPTVPPKVDPYDFPGGDRVDPAARLAASDLGPVTAPGCNGGCGRCTEDYCDGCSRCCGCLLRCIKPSDRDFSEFISPMTNPVFFEDPRTLTEARFIFLHHRVPSEALGGEINLFAVQLRAALSNRLSVIATKDGFATSSNPLIDDGWSDLSVGLKYNLLADPANQRLLSAGATYEIPVGSTRTLQGNGDGLFNVFLTGGADVGIGHVISGTGFLLPVDTSDESTIWFWSNHFDSRIGNTWLYWLAELNWYKWLKSGGNGLPGIEGGDLFNFGSTGVAGNDIVTAAIGVKLKPTETMEIGVAWEAPLTDRRDVLHDRFTFDWILRY